MRKILFVTDAIRLDVAYLEFACYMCSLTHSKLTGIFLENSSFEVREREKIVQTALATDEPGTTVSQLKNKYTEDSIACFQNACETRGVNFELQRDKGMPLTDILHESRFADLVIADPSISFSRDPETAPSRFMTELLNAAECPVITAPFDFEGIDEIVFAYDGSPSATYAMKQFTYLLPEFSSKKITVLNVMGPGTTSAEDDEKMNAWLKTYYQQYETAIVEDNNVRNCLVANLLGRKKSIVVMGAFGRNAISTMLSPSHAMPLLKFGNQPLFITHR